MPNRYTVPEPDSDNFTDWEGDKTFDLKPQAEALTNLVFGLDESFTIGLEAGWGTGKSIFLKRWKTIEKNKDKMVIYFDAFQHDYLEDPFLALTHDILEAVGSGEEADNDEIEIITSIKKAAQKLWRPILRAAAANSSIPFAPEIFDAVTGSDEANDPFYYEDKRREEMELFRAELERLADAQGKIVIIVDELDRCRPDFALGLLEIIKHLFSVPKVHFILGLNADALADMIRVRYGITSDGRSYLGKFINVWMKHNPVSRITHQNVLIAYFENNFREMGLSGAYQDHAAAILRLSMENGASPSLRDLNGLLTDLAIAPAFKFNGAQAHLGSQHCKIPMTFVSILLILRRLKYELFIKIRHYEQHHSGIHEEILGWLGVDKQSDELLETNLIKAISSHLNYEDFITRFTGNKTIDWHSHNAETGVYNLLDKMIFKYLETISIKPGEDDDEDTKTPN